MAISCHYAVDCLWRRVAMCGPQERVSDAAVNSMHRRDNPLNLEPHCSNELVDYWEVGNLLEGLEEQDHNMWNEGLSLITGYRASHPSMPQ